MPKGGWRGGVKPRAWLLRDGEPATTSQLEVPKEFLSAVREVAHMFDRGELTIEDIRTFREMLKTRSIEEIKTEEIMLDNTGLPRNTLLHTFSIYNAVVEASDGTLVLWNNTLGFRDDDRGGDTSMIFVNISEHENILAAVDSFVDGCKG